MHLSSEEAPSAENLRNFHCHLRKPFTQGNLSRILEVVQQAFRAPQVMPDSKESEQSDLSTAMQEWRSRRLSKMKSKDSVRNVRRQLLQARQEGGPSLSYLEEVFTGEWPGRCFCHDHRLLGQGATADVFLGQWRSTTEGEPLQPVAIKVFKTSSSCDRAFSRELAIGSRLRHPNLGAIYAGSSRAPYVLIQEYCMGGTLHKLLHPAPLPAEGQARLEPAAAAGIPTLKQRFQIALGVARAIAFFHEAKPPVVHRDLKSENVMLLQPLTSPDDVPVAKVVDFGLSRAVKAGGSWDPKLHSGPMTRQVGSLRWMAPEMLLTGEYNESVDTYAFGLLFFELLTLMVPYGEDERHLPKRLELFVTDGGRPDEVPTSPGLHEAPTWAISLMRRAWAQVPADRPPFTEIVAEIERAIGEPPFPAP